MDEAKFSTQKILTYCLVAIFAVLAGWVFYGDDQAERSTVLQTVINLVILAVGYWLGSSKGAADTREQMGRMLQPQSESMSRIAEASAPTAAAAVAAAYDPPTTKEVSP